MSKSTGTGAGTGTGTGSGVSTPGLTKVAAGEYVTELLVNGQIYALGDTDYEGVNNNAVPPAPIANIPAGTSFTDVAAGLHQGLGLDSTGHVWTWGDNTNGQLGNGQDNGGSDNTPSLPAMITRDVNGNAFDNVIAVAASDQANGAIKGDGTVWVWGGCGPSTGSNSAGLTGEGTEGGDVVYPTQVLIPLASGVKITKLLMGNVMLALASDGGVWVWGGGPQNQYGLGTANNNYETPQQVPHLPVQIATEVTEHFTQLFAGPIIGVYIYAQTESGKLYSWGRNKTGNLGNGVVPPNSVQAGDYPNSWDVTVPTLVSPMSLTRATPTQSPFCAPNPAASNCTCADGTNNC